jgi:hypothetical protein
VESFTKSESETRSEQSEEVARKGQENAVWASEGEVLAAQETANKRGASEELEEEQENKLEEEEQEEEFKEGVAHWRTEGGVEEYN